MFLSPACVSPPAWRKEWRHYPASLQHYRSPFGGNAENGRSHPFPDSGDPASETLSPVTPICAETTGSGWAAFLYALKLYELHKLSDLSTLSHSHLRYFAASLIGDKLSAQALADAVMAIPDLEAAALQLRIAPSGAMAVSKSLCRRWQVPAATGGNQCLSTWLLL